MSIQKLKNELLEMVRQEAFDLNKSTEEILIELFIYKALEYDELLEKIMRRCEIPWQNS